ncbi:MAG: hypothetical protein U9Q40_04745 [Campylobacterota bacterium]|nr:hypothetical protein [Campylobacterota bacterium]
MKLLLLSLLFISSLLANKVIYLSYDEVPQRVVKGEIFSVTLKALSTVRNFQDIEYTFSNETGLEILNTTPYREVKGKYYYETFYFSTTASQAKLPDIEATLVTLDDYIGLGSNPTEIIDVDDYNNSDELNDTTLLIGAKLNVITLNPKKNFSNIIANTFELVEYKTTTYDNNHNIIVFVATATNSDIEKMNFQGVFKQGIESVTASYFDSRITYYLVIKKQIENFSFSYFDLTRNRFIRINIPIIVDDDSVTTQSDIKPKDQSRVVLKMQIAAAVAFIGFVFILWRKKYIYLVFILIPLVYIIYLSIPAKEICVKEGSQIHLLPVDNGTIFQTTYSQHYFQKEGNTKRFIKVKLKNERIGWVKNEDICSL